MAKRKTADRSPHASAESALRQLYEQRRGDLAHYLWESESERWRELLVSLIAVAGPTDLHWARRAGEILEQLNLLDPSVLGQLSPADRAFCGRCLEKLGASPDAARRMVSVLIAAARAVQEGWAGHIQRMLRSHAELMLLDVRRLLAKSGLSDDQILKAGTLWLQNAAGMPLLLESDPHVQSFCTQHSITPAELVGIADRVTLNLAVLDDLLALSHTRP